MSQPSTSSKSKVQGPVDLGNGKHQYIVQPSSKFEVPKTYQITKALGYGAYGVVCAATNSANGHKYAIKKCQKVFKELEDGKRILREIKLLTFFNHENLLSISDLLPPNDKNFDDIYIVGDLMDSDLNNVLRSKQKLTEEHYQYFIYQILRGMKYIHSASVLHRDLKPANILCNISCDLRICDFGLARGFNPNDSFQELTDYVVTRWYRPPELLLMCSQYTPAVDIWSCGCIFAELMNRKPLFQGKDYIDQLQLITNALGTPSEQDITWLASLPEQMKYMKNLPKKSPRPWESIVPQLTNPLAQDFISKMLVFNPQKRLSAAELLAHPYLSQLHDPNDEPSAPAPFNWEHDARSLTEAQLRNLFWEEIVKFHPELSTGL
jgi:mitogen-activated protein kinase 1/3